MEILNIKVCGGCHRFRVVVKSFIQRDARIDIIALTAFSRSIGDGLANINRAGKLTIAVYVREDFIRGEIPGVVKSVHSGPNERLRRQREYFGFKKRVRGAFSKMPLVKRVERRVHRVVVSISHCSSSFPFVR